MTLMMAVTAGCVTVGDAGSVAGGAGAISSLTGATATSSPPAPPGATVASSPPAPPGAEACSGCHPASVGVSSPVPRLIGMNRQVIIDAMAAFRTGQRPATVMDRIAKGYDDAETQAIATWFAGQR